MADYLKTPQAARLLEASYTRLINLVRFDKITPPARDGSGDFIWSAEDIERARQALANGRRRKVTSEEAASAR